MGNSLLRISGTFQENVTLKQNDRKYALWMTAGDIPLLVDLLSRETVTPHPSAFGCHLLPLEKALNLDRPHIHTRTNNLIASQIRI